MEKRQRRLFTADLKAQAVVRHFQDGVAVSALCEELGIHPNQFYDWQKLAFSNLPAAFQKESGAETRRLNAEVMRINAKLAQKDEVISELLTEHIALKKKTGGL
jgi:transposase-like protein